MPPSLEIQKLAALIRLVAHEELLPRHGRLRADQVHTHTDGSLFTEADLRSELRLTAGARLIWPGIIATGEEEISENPGGFFQSSLGQNVIVFDPIDGTGAFKRGEDTYGVMAAVIQKGITIAGVIYSPGHALNEPDGNIRAEKDLMIVVEKGAGCYINGKRISLQNRPTLTQDANIAFACRNQDSACETLLADGLAGYLPRSNSSHDYERLLTGETDATFYSEGFMPKTGLGKCPPWDHAAGVLAVQEAGGFARLPYGRWGKPYDPLHCHDRLLVCANKDLFMDVLHHIRVRAPELCQPRRAGKHSFPAP